MPNNTRILSILIFTVKFIISYFISLFYRDGTQTISWKCSIFFINFLLIPEVFSIMI